MKRGVSAGVVIRNIKKKSCINLTSWNDEMYVQTKFDLEFWNYASRTLILSHHLEFGDLEKSRRYNIAH